jgi:hypothetical protein
MAGIKAGFSKDTTSYQVGYHISEIFLNCKDFCYIKQPSKKLQSITKYFKIYNLQPTLFLDCAKQSL